MAVIQNAKLRQDELVLAQIKKSQLAMSVVMVKNTLLRNAMMAISKTEMDAQKHALLKLAGFVEL